MDYVEWCDKLAIAIANYAETQHYRHINLHSFANQFTSARCASESTTVQRSQIKQAVILDSHGLLKLLRLAENSPSVQLKYSDLDLLRSNYDRWVSANDIQLDDLSLMLLGTLNRKSQDLSIVPPAILDIDLESVHAEPAASLNGKIISVDHARELLDRMESLGLVKGTHLLGPKKYKSTYLGLARTERTQIAKDRDIDVLRTAGEGDSLDYKRHYKLKTDVQKWEFVKDVTALANAGGAGSRYLLLGVEDDGEFFVSNGPTELTEHKKLLDDTTETRIQQIVSSRTTVSPSVRIVARGDHRNGPFVLIQIVRQVEHLPYRIYKDQEDRDASDADNRGEVWIRKGTTKAQCTAAEIAHLEHQSALFDRTHEPSE